VEAIVGMESTPMQQQQQQLVEQLYVGSAERNDRLTTELPQTDHRD